MPIQFSILLLLFHSDGSSRSKFIHAHTTDPGELPPTNFLADNAAISLSTRTIARISISILIEEELIFLSSLFLEKEDVAGGLVALAEAAAGGTAATWQLIKDKGPPNNNLGLHPSKASFYRQQQQRG